MPSRLHHGEQRSELAQAAAAAIARYGIERVRLTDIAREAGCTTGRVSHYYQNKEEVLLDAWRCIQTLGVDQVAEAYRQTDDDPMAVLEAVLPTDAQGVMLWRVGLAVADRALRDKALAKRRLVADHEVVEMLAKALQRWAAKLGLEFESHQEARALMTFAWGLGTQSLSDPNGWPPDAMRAAIKRWLDRLAQTAQMTAVK